jgi:hypothetical protein
MDYKSLYWVGSMSGWDYEIPKPFAFGVGTPKELLFALFLHQNEAAVHN